jgi:hypothetical protein
MTSYPEDLETQDPPSEIGGASAKYKDMKCKATPRAQVQKANLGHPTYIILTI